MSRILLVEDDPEYQELVRLLLASHDLTVLSSIESALETLAAERFSLIISDINLLGMSGLEFLEQMREMDPSRRPPIIISSSQHDPATRQEVMAKGAAGFLPKPYEAEQLLALVRSLLA